ncbi:adhesin [Izhakiella australiensis]|uniref:Adhesin n=1 Tax=Izhakiella australiensis TaxID=1926881 RepID=A0A1S8YN73_9GAMM|nr:fimbrial protein [Izhakiella australiensis]OON40530.1 adhesin [Izhakiella australiensis]
MNQQTILRLLSTIGLFFPLSVFATVCDNYYNVPTDISYDLSNTFNTSNNAVGKIVTLDGYTQGIGVWAVCPAGTTGKRTYRSYVTSLPINRVIDGFKYISLNDYLDVAMSITDNTAGVFYPPVNYMRMGEHWKVPEQGAFPIADSNLRFKLIVKRRLINKVVIPPKTLFRVYVTSTNSDPLTKVVYTIGFSGVIDVPQSCVINSGANITFNFGDMGSTLFSQAGAGHKPAGVNPQWKSVGVKCDNIAAEALLTMRLEADNTVGDALVSDNPDLGFVIADANGKPLTPNSFSSTIPFTVDDTSGASVRLGAWPVSITGKKPKAGPFTSFGYLRVDFN